MMNEINNINNVKISLEELKPLLNTGRSITSETIMYGKKTKVYKYRNGILTTQGDIEESVWVKAVKSLAQSLGEYNLLENLTDRNFVGFHCKSDKELQGAACRLYIGRIYDNKKWVRYVQFNDTYRPEILKNDTDIIYIIPKCCKDLCQTTKQLVSESKIYDNKITCPICGKRTDFIVGV